MTRRLAALGAVALLALTGCAGGPAFDKDELKAAAVEVIEGVQRFDHGFCAGKIEWQIFEESGVTATCSRNTGADQIAVRVSDSKAMSDAFERASLAGPSETVLVKDNWYVLTRAPAAVSHLKSLGAQQP